MRNRRTILMLAAALMLALTVSLPSCIPADAAAGDDIGLIPERTVIGVDPGSSATVHLVAVNTLPAGNGLADGRAVEVTVTADGVGVGVLIDRGFLILTGQEHAELILEVSADRYAEAGMSTVVVRLESRSLDPADTVVSSSSLVLQVEVSPTPGGDAFNKILGVFENRLPAPFGGPLGTAVLTALIILLAGIALIMAAGPAVLRVVFRSHPPEQRRRYRASVDKFLMLAVALFAFNMALATYGVPAGVVATVSAWSRVLYIVLAAVIAWGLYTMSVGHFTSRLDAEGADGGDLEPLLRLIGKVVIATVAVAAVLSGFGLSLTAIVTGAGLVTLGITYGAQNVLSQFFNGMVLLITRPFKKGDLVQFGDSDVYRVRKVNVMETVFDNWFNNDVVIMPNDKVASATISNLTGKSSVHKITIAMTFAYGTDISGVRRVMAETAAAHPGIVTDGSVSRPYTYIGGFGESGIRVMLVAYVVDVERRSSIGADLGVGLYERFMADRVSVLYPRTDVRILDGDE